MTQNTSTAVMQRRAEPHRSLDDFPTPPWATRALCKVLLGSTLDQVFERGAIRPGMSCREPAANRGHMVRPLREYFASVDASDIHDYGAGFPVQDYLFGPPPSQVDWTITNPPFRLAEQFIARALETSRYGVAVLVRSAFLEGVGRFARLFSIRPPTRVLQFTERVVMHKGRLAPEGRTATAYCWVVWEDPGTPIPCHTRFEWIAPCRKVLERPEDYACPPNRSPAHE